MTDAGQHPGHEQVDVLIVGAGPAGLAAARALAMHGVRDVLVVDREQQAGGVPRHCHHGGFGLRDLHRPMSGPRYAAALVRRAVAAGVRVQAETMATRWAGPGAVRLTSPAGIRTVSATAIVLATGARERPRAARLVPGDRPEGVFTTGQLQQWSHLHRLPVGQRAIVVGAEHVSYSAVLTLRAAGVRTVGMVTSLPRHQSFAAFAATMRWGLRVPLWTGTELAVIHGHGRVREVELHSLSTGARRTVEVDTVVFTGDWIPDNELARSAGLRIDGSSRGPVVDGLGASTAPGIYVAGNLAHPAETADVAALRGAAVGAGLAARFAHGEAAPASDPVDIVVAPPLLWSSPGRVGPAAAASPGLPRGLVLRSEQFAGRATVLIEQGARQLGSFPVRRVAPNRSLRVPLEWAVQVDPDAGPVRVRLR
jgi:thioredoxin reductase